MRMRAKGDATLNKGSVADWFANALLGWFDVHGRKNLPWQRDPTPYRVWISEVMLQQTQVSTVIPYYERFLSRFPDLRCLADASLDEVLHLWSGLGYYARARNLHRCAQRVCRDFAGELPNDIEELQSLPGIGRSTAGAILALSLGQRHPILDGNAKRVLARVHAVEEWPSQPAAQKRLWQLAEAATPHIRIREYTQAIMDLGATLCTRARPACERCPLRQRCLARASGAPTAYPRPKPRIVRATRELRPLLLVDAADSILLERRSHDGIWGGLWSLPEAPAEIADNGEALQCWCRNTLYCTIDDIESLPERRHELTHLSLLLRPITARVAATCGLMEGDQHVWYNGDFPRARGMPAPIQRLIHDLLASKENTDGSQGSLRQAG